MSATDLILEVIKNLFSILMPQKWTSPKFFSIDENSQSFCSRYCGKWKWVISHLTLYQMTKFKFNPFPNKPCFLRVCSTRLLKTLWEKEKLLVTSNFSFSQCFLPIRRTFYHFQRIWNCRLQTPSVWMRLKFVVWERVNSNGKRLQTTKQRCQNLKRLSLT